MALYTVRSWTIWGLIGAFVDLAVAYFLLCASAFVFFPYKFCNLLGLDLPCPCNGVFGYRNSYLCWHKLLIDLPGRNILYVQMMIKSKFPFDLIWFQYQPCNSDRVLCSCRICDHGVLELENEACSSSFWNPKFQNLVDRESGFDAKGKKIVKQRYGTRRRRRSSLAYGKSSFMQSVVAGASSSTYKGIDGIQGDERNAANGLDLGERKWDSFEQSGVYGKTKVEDNDSSLSEKLICNAQEKFGKPGNEETMIRKLEEALQEEKNTCATVRLELEKERAAAASATDEAMAMILRLQADKAAIEMEARQYQRMIEEQFAYEEEEMEILKEILVRREKENHFLEKEVEAYRQLKSLGNGQTEIDLSYMISELGQKPVHSPDRKVDPSWLQQEIRRSTSTKSANWPPSYEASSIEVTSEAFQTCSGVEESPSCCGEKLKKDRNYKAEVHDNLHGSILDSEPIIYDVHVIDDKTELQREEKGKASGLSNCAVTDFGVSSGELLSDSSSTSMAQSNHINGRNSSEMKNRMPELGNSRCKNFLVDSARSASPAASGENLKIDTEVELLRERLRIVQVGKDELSFSAEQWESMNAQLKLVEDMLNQLREIQQLKEPVGQASLPPSSSKVSSTIRRKQSMSLESLERS